VWFQCFGYLCLVFCGKVEGVVLGWFGRVLFCVCVCVCVCVCEVECLESC